MYHVKLNTTRSTIGTHGLFAPMIQGKKLIIVLPAYNAEATLRRTYAEIPFDIVDDVILVDDASDDRTSEVASKLGIQHIIRHAKNRGYGANQKTCYDKALALGADIIIMLHPDYQYTPKLIPAMASIIASDVYPAVLGSRILGGGALRGGMPLYKYISNRFLTHFQNVLIGQKLSEYHTGYRAYSRKVLESVNYRANSDNFLFDNQFLSQVFMAGFYVAEVTCPTKYFEEASSTDFRASSIYGVGVLKTSLCHFLHKMHLAKFKIYDKPRRTGL